MSYDLTKLVKLEGLQQLANRIKSLFYDKDEIDAKLDTIVPIEKGGTGNSDGYIRTGQKVDVSIGQNATAEGTVTTASGNHSHAEGLNTIASKTASHAEGTLSTASGNYSHAEGQSTTASGNASHAEGANTLAGGTSHAEGINTEAQGSGAHAEGKDTLAELGHAEGMETHSIGYSSHAEGYKTYASGNSHAEGGETKAIGFYSHAEGLGTIASGDYSHAEGSLWTNMALHTTLTGQGNSTSITYTPGPSNPQINDVISLNSNGFPNAKVLMIEENNTITLDKPLSENDFTDQNFYRVYRNEVSGNGSHVEGWGNIISGETSHGEGQRNTVSGTRSHTEGYQNTITGNTSHSEGNSNTISGNCSHAEGISNEVSGDYSHAEGRNNTVIGDYAHAEGYFTIAQRKVQHVFGKYNIADTEGEDGTTLGNYVEIVGNGMTRTNRSNARTLDWNGNEFLAGTLTVSMNPTENMQVATKKYVDDHNYITAYKIILDYDQNLEIPNNLPEVSDEYNDWAYNYSKIDALIADKQGNLLTLEEIQNLNLKYCEFYLPYPQNSNDLVDETFLYPIYNINYINTTDELTDHRMESLISFYTPDGIINAGLAFVSDRKK